MGYHISVHAMEAKGAVIHFKFDDELWSEAAREASEDVNRSTKLFEWIESVFTIEGMCIYCVSFGMGVLEVCYEVDEDPYADLRT
tara:strand:- start:475 stop:729 length:255 start_codon:yes stop_codon:yes gene_type:complete